MKKLPFPKVLLMLVLVALAVIGFGSAALAEEAAAPTVESNAAAIAAVQTNADFIWTLVAAFLVFFMQAGFAMVETGMTRAKNAVNIMMKNAIDFAAGSLAFWVVGFGLMFGVSNGFFGTTDFLLSGTPREGDATGWLYAFWIFQVVFAATAATIVSGAMAERTKFVSYVIYSIVISAVIYPIFGSWAWGSLYKGSGWLEGMGFIDFAGSTVVHSIGGWCSLAGAMILGPRIGKYSKDGKINAIPGHNMPLAALGVFILWFGWFGFNPGSTTAANTDTALIAVNTNLAAAAGMMTAMIVSWIKFKKPELGMTLNGALAGLVAITAGCANVSPAGAVAIGAIAGVLVFVSVLFFDKIKIDDPVGAVSVHGVCGAFGTLAVGIFDTTGNASLVTQAIGVATCFAWSFTLALILFKVLKATVGLRVSVEEETEGLDYAEHGGSAYPNFVVSGGSLGMSGFGTASMASAPSGAPAMAHGRHEPAM